MGVLYSWQACWSEDTVYVKNQFVEAYKMVAVFVGKAVVQWRYRDGRIRGDT